jgi:hypothetical protein
MGIVCSFTTISDESIEMVRRHPLLIKKWFYSEEEFEEFVKHEQSKLGFFAKLFGKNSKPLPDYSPTGNENIQWDVDKAWFGIHFLLTGTTGAGQPPLNFIITGGQEAKGCDFGYGSGRMFTSDQVKEINQALQGILKEDLITRYDPQQLVDENEFPNLMDMLQDEDSLEYVSENFVGMKQGIHRMVEQNMGMIVGFS